MVNNSCQAQPIAIATFLRALFCVKQICKHNKNLKCTQSSSLVCNGALSSTVNHPIPVNIVFSQSYP